MKPINALNPYALLMALRRRLFASGLLRSTRVGVPVIALGNLSLGGTGKTPTTILIARHLRDELGVKVCVLLRGYGRSTKGLLVVSEGNGPLVHVGRSGDEAYLLSEVLLGCTVIADENRVRGAQKAIELGAEVIVLDDAFQHMRIARDLNILLVDQEKPPGAVLPFGRWREDASAARDADILLLTNAEDEARAKAVARELSVSSGIQKPFARVRAHSAGLASLDPAIPELMPMRTVTGKKVLALSSIASPERFHRLLEQQGASLSILSLPDHAAYSPKEMDRVMAQFSRAHCDMIVTTAKDAVKCRELLMAQNVPAYILEHELEFLSGRQTLLHAIDALFTEPTVNDPMARRTT